MSIGDQITGIAHLGMGVHDLAIARAFYETLGFVVIAGPVGPEPAEILEHRSGTNANFILNASSAQTENILMDVPEKDPGYAHTALAVRHLHGVQEELEARSVGNNEGPIELEQRL